MKKPTGATPIRRRLRSKSGLRTVVQDGVGAVKASDRQCFDVSVRTSFADSLDLDAAMRPGHEQENRWDYLLGHTASAEIVAVEPHSAKSREVSVVVAKRARARDHLRDHLIDGARVERWLWVASGNVQFADTEKERRILDQNGIIFVGKVVMAKHLPTATTERRPRPGKVRRER